jgi:uncharacterized protein YdhG (YjbR/CyaY superfamily)
LSHVKKAVRAKALKDVDEYIAKAPRVAQEKLSMMRTIVRAAAPDAEEVISYDMPYYKFHGPLVGFAAYKTHVSLFGAFPDNLKEELRPYKTGKGSVQFPLDKPLPAPLITKIVRAHMRLNEARDI